MQHALRIWHQSMTELADVSAYRDALEVHARKILDSGYKIEVHGLPAGSYRGRAPTAALGNAFAHHRILEPVMTLAVSAELQGFDAFVIGSFSEPFLRELRSAVDMPVVSVAEAVFLTACSIGRQSAPITNDAAIAGLVRRSIAEHGLEQRVQSPRAIVPALNEFELSAAFSDPTALLNAFRAAAQTAVAAGADVIVPAEGVLSECLQHHGITQMAGAPVLDSFGVAWLYAAMMIRLRRETGLSVSRIGDYRRDDSVLIRELVGHAPSTHKEKTP